MELTLEVGDNLRVVAMAALAFTLVYGMWKVAIQHVPTKASHV